MVEWLARLAMRRSRVRVQLWPLAGFVLCRLEFKSSATLVNIVLELFVSKYSSGVPVN